VIVFDPVVVRSVAGIVAVRCVESTNVVVLAELFQLTTEPAMKFVPLTASVKAPSPEKRLVGEIPDVVGVGFGETTRRLPVPDFEPFVSVPDPVTVKVVVPAGVEPVVEMVRVVEEPPETEVGEKEPVAPVGRPLIVKLLTVQFPPLFVVVTV